MESAERGTMTHLKPATPAQCINWINRLEEAGIAITLPGRTESKIFGNDCRPEAGYYPDLYIEDYPPHIVALALQGVDIWADR